MPMTAYRSSPHMLDAMRPLLQETARQLRSVV
jgi:hypothetical protein